MSWRFINLRSIDGTSSHTTMQAMTRGGVGGLVGSSHADLGSSKLIQVVFLYCYGSSLNMKVKPLLKLGYLLLQFPDRLILKTVFEGPVCSWS